MTPLFKGNQVENYGTVVLLQERILAVVKRQNDEPRSLSHCSLTLTLSKIFQSFLLLLLMKPPCDFYLCFSSLK
ncbi:hypothetical protein VNO80_10476 [Phaseolus coccineus]|uniref:Uncharacterized protein n=1 Tax=Phaseolus coccineus TaxID=3886 RepID=A0AAN9RAH6_PHACN